MGLKEATLASANCMRSYAIELSCMEPDAALSVARCYGDFLKNNYIGVYSDVDFERHFIGIYSELFKSKKSQGNFKLLHLMTEAYALGGHTRVVERLLCGGLGDGIASLEVLPEQVLGKIPSNVRQHPHLRKASGVETIERIIDCCLEYGFIILHIHPDDIYSAIAAGVVSKQRVKVYFYNHADHCFSFGFAGAEKVFEISKYGWNKGDKRHLGPTQSYVGIPISDLGYRAEKCAAPNSLNGVLAGSVGKLKPYHDLSVPRFLNNLFARPEASDVRINIIGVSGRESMWRALSQAASTRVAFLERVSHTEYLESISHADFYVDSFPLGNGTGFAEAVALGKPSFGMDILSGSSVADRLRSHSIDELIEKLVDFFRGSDAWHGELIAVRDEVRKAQGVGICIQRIRQVMNGGDKVALPEPLSSQWCLEDFFERQWIENNLIIIVGFPWLSNLRLVNRLRLVRCWRDTWPFLSSLRIVAKAIGGISRIWKTA